MKLVLLALLIGSTSVQAQDDSMAAPSDGAPAAAKPASQPEAKPKAKKKERGVVLVAPSDEGDRTNADGKQPQAAQSDQTVIVRVYEVRTVAQQRQGPLIYSADPNDNGGGVIYYPNEVPNDNGYARRQADARDQLNQQYQMGTWRAAQQPYFRPVYNHPPQVIYGINGNHGCRSNIHFYDHRRD